MATESQFPDSPDESPVDPAPANSSGDDTLARGKSGEGAHSALVLLRRRLKARGLLEPAEPPDAEPDIPC
jgi:hypothetical protein